MPRVRPRLTAAVVVVLGLVPMVAAVLPTGMARAQDDLMGEIKTIASVRFEGRHRVSARELRSVIKTRSPSIWPWRDRPVLRADFLRSDTLAIRDRYRLHGFLDASVGVGIASTRDSGRMAVIFLIREGPQTRVARVDFAGVRSYPENQLRRRLLTKPGEPFDPFALQLDTLRISELYQERGFRPWVVARAWRGDGADSVRARVEFEVDEGNRFRVGDLFVIHNPRAVEERLIRRELLLRTGDFYRRSFMVRSWERLYDTGLFSQVQISPIVDSERDSIDFQVSVRERKPRWLDAGIGSGTAERYRITSQWGHRNLLGVGLQGALGARLAANGSGQFLLARGEASLLAPWIFGRRIRGVVTPFYERADDRTDPDWLRAQHFRGVRFELRRELNRFSRLVLTQDNTWVLQSLTQFADSLHPDTIAAKKAAVVPSYSTHSISLGGHWDYRDNPFNPLTGSYHAATIEVAGGPLQGTSSFRKISAVSSWYTPVGGWVLATRIQAGVMEPTGSASPFSPPGDEDPTVARVPPEDRFRAGGVNSIRGYGDNRIPPRGGLAMIVANAELRIPVAGPLGIEAYLDLGNVWARPEYLKGSDFVPSINRVPLDAGDVRYVVGIGPRLNLPIGPVRFDATWGLRPPQGGEERFLGFQFAIGPSF